MFEEIVHKFQLFENFDFKSNSQHKEIIFISKNAITQHIKNTSSSILHLIKNTHY